MSDISTPSLLEQIEQTIQEKKQKEQMEQLESLTKRIKDDVTDAEAWNELASMHDQNGNKPMGIDRMSYNSR